MIFLANKKEFSNPTRTLAWPCDNFFSSISLITSLGKVKSLRQLAMWALLLPINFETLSWSYWNWSISLLYPCASSMGLRSSLWTFSTIANSNDFKSSASTSTIGTSCRPAFWAACHLLSPAIISYLFDCFLTTIGCMIPRSLIELVS